MLGSAVMLPLGWHWYAANRKPITSIESTTDESWLQRVRIGVAPARGGAHFSAGWTF